MKQIFVAVLFFCIANTVNAQSPELSNLVQTAKTEANPPFKANVKDKRMPKGASVESLKRRRGQTVN